MAKVRKKRETNKKEENKKDKIKAQSLADFLY